MILGKIESDAGVINLLSLVIPKKFAAVITPVGGIQHKGKFHVFYSETEVGPVTRKLYNELTGIQFGDVEAPEGWIVKVE